MLRVCIAIRCDLGKLGRSRDEIKVRDQTLFYMPHVLYVTPSFSSFQVLVWAQMRKWVVGGKLVMKEPLTKV